MNSLTIKQTIFLAWVQRNYEWLKSKGFEPPIQSYPHWLYGIITSGEYTELDKMMINETIQFIKGLGLNTYNQHWTWDKGGAELDWLVNLRTVGIGTINTKP